MADVSQIKLPNGTTYTLKDEGALQLTGGNVTGPVNFGDSVSIDDLNAGQLVVSGSASITNNLQVNTINGVAVGSSPKFTDNNTTYSAGTGLSLSSTTFSVKLGYTTSGNNRAVQADSNGNLYVTQKDDNTTALTSMTGTLGIDHGGTGKTSALAAITNLGGPYLLDQGTEITASSNLDTAYKAMGTYYSGSSTSTGTLAGTVPFTGSGFKMITAIGYRTATLRQFAGGANNDLFYRSSQNTGSSWTKWYKFALLPSGSDDKTFAAVGGSTTPVYVNSSGVVTACSYTIAKSVPADAQFTDSGGTVTSITLTQGTGISIGSSGTAITTSGSRTISLATITKSNTTSTASPAHGETFTAIDSITYDTYGRVTGVNTKTVTLPASGNTDTKVTQSVTTTSNWRKVLVHYSTNENYADVPATVTNQVYAAKGVEIQPSTGTLSVRKLNIYAEGATTANTPATIQFIVKDTTTKVEETNSYIKVYNDHGTSGDGTNMVIRSGGGMFIGGGEAPSSHYAEKGADYTGEAAFITADSSVYIQGGGNTIANRVGFYVNASHQVIPCAADVATNDIGSIGTSSYKWANLYVTKINGTTVPAITAATAGTSSATSGNTLAVPYVTYNAKGMITAAGTHTHTIFTYGTSDLTAGTSALTTGTLYCVYI